MNLYEAYRIVCIIRTTLQHSCIRRNAGWCRNRSVCRRATHPCKSRSSHYAETTMTLWCGLRWRHDQQPSEERRLLPAGGKHHRDAVLCYQHRFFLRRIYCSNLVHNQSMLSFTAFYTSFIFISTKWAKKSDTLFSYVYVMPYKWQNTTYCQNVWNNFNAWC